MDSKELSIFKQLRIAVQSAPVAPLEVAEPAVCTLFERCKGCPYPAHGFSCYGQDGDCLRQYMRIICGIKEDSEKCLETT